LLAKCKELGLKGYTWLSKADLLELVANVSTTKIREESFKEKDIDILLKKLRRLAIRGTKNNKRDRWFHINVGDIDYSILIPAYGMT